MRCCIAVTKPRRDSFAGSGDERTRGAVAFDTRAGNGCRARLAVPLAGDAAGRLERRRRRAAPRLAWVVAGGGAHLHRRTRVAGGTLARDRRPRARYVIWRRLRFHRYRDPVGTRG